MSKLRLIVADDHHILLDGLKSLLQKQKDIEIVGLFTNGKKVYEALPDLEVDIALLDINMPEMNGHELTIKIKKEFPSIAVIILSMYDDAGHIMELVEAGASGYLLKNITDKELLEAIRTVASGKLYFSNARLKQTGKNFLLIADNIKSMKNVHWFLEGIIKTLSVTQ